MPPATNAELPAMPSQMPSYIVGVWKLLSIQVEFADTGERADVYGPNRSVISFSPKASG